MLKPRTIEDHQELLWSPRPTAASQGQNIPTRTEEAGRVVKERDS